NLDRSTTITTSYTFASSVGYPEVGTTFQWYRQAGPMTTAISGATGRSYTPTSADAGQSIKFCVTPRTRTATGDQVCTSPVGISNVTFYEDVELGGTAFPQYTVLDNCVNLSSFNDRTSSINLIGAPNPSHFATTVYYYKDADCSGSGEA